MGNRTAARETSDLSGTAASVMWGRVPSSAIRTFVFGNGRRYASWSDPKATLNSRAGLTGWRLHDLRRTAAARMAELGTLPHITEAVLNHVSGHRAARGVGALG